MLLVVSVAKKFFYSKGMPLADLIQEGNLGLMKAAYKYEAERGFRFGTYAYWWIAQNICRTIVGKSRVIRIPSHVVKKMVKVFRVKDKISQAQGATASPQEMADALEWPLKQVEYLLELGVAALEDLDRPILAHEESEPLIELYQDYSNPLSRRGSTPELTRAALYSAIDYELEIGRITHRDKEVLEWRFGFKDGEAKDRQIIGKNINRNRERVRQLENNALRILRENHPDLAVLLSEFD